MRATPYIKCREINKVKRKNFLAQHSRIFQHIHDYNTGGTFHLIYYTMSY